MAKKISELDPAGTITGAELAELVQAGASKQGTLQAIIDALAPRNAAAITGLTGGGATNLDGLATANGAIRLGTMVILSISNIGCIYQLVAGAQAENSPSIIRPDDYAASTNEVVWRLQQLKVVGDGGGKIKSASNVGTAGVGIFKNKKRGLLEFKKLNAASTKVTITDDSENDEVDVDVNEANLTLGNIGGTLSNAKLKAMAENTVKGRISAGTGDPEDLTPTNIREIINVEAGADVTDDENVRAALALATADIAVNGQRITSVGTPTQSSDATPKDYVDALAHGLDWKKSVRVATGSNIVLSGTQEIDGLFVVPGDRVLVKTQPVASQNGIYIVADDAWIRSEDANADNEVTSGLAVFVEHGSLNASTGWVLATHDPITLGTTALTFTQFTGGGEITATNIGPSGVGIYKQKQGNELQFRKITSASNSLRVLERPDSVVLILFPATDAAAGIVQRATDAQAKAGESETTYVSPAQVKAIGSGGGRSGSRITTSSDSITLTKADDQVQAVIMTIANRVVKLPDTRTLTEGDSVFVISNYSGRIPFKLTDADNVVIGEVLAGEQARCELLIQSSAAGFWIIEKSRVDEPFYMFGVTEDFENDPTERFSHTVLMRLNRTTALFCYVAGDFKKDFRLKAVVLNITATSISFGTPVVVADDISGYTGTTSPFGGTALSYNKAVLFYSTGSSFTSDSNETGAVLSISGSNIVVSKQSLSVTTGVTANRVACEKVSETKVIVNMAAALFVATITGTRITTGTPYITNGGLPRIIVVSESKVVIATGRAGGSIKSFSIVGNTITFINSITIGGSVTENYIFWLGEKTSDRQLMFCSTLIGHQDSAFLDINEIGLFGMDTTPITGAIFQGPPQLIQGHVDNLDILSILTAPTFLEGRMLLYNNDYYDNLAKVRSREQVLRVVYQDYAGNITWSPKKVIPQIKSLCENVEAFSNTRYLFYSASDKRFYMVAIPR